ncbi:DUF2155 domain-containing protein [Erythrobacter sp. THAF29]|uniref:DUF2155 domain-containing protein n=1 Tax=Erythrobacter sp. THAF29 TaxID=2587851 RepID=UPI0012688B42|nr:DUF2155 domain-containing protein [Erythrobacter sp. THAF29]QFT76778.1 hypothetical protein FIU90_04390 [Erythrobacter sp. THAF29]
MAARRLSLVLLPALALAACGGEADEPETVRASLDGPEEAEPASTAAPDAETREAIEGATPMEDRVATIGLLNKRNNLSQDFELSPGESVEEGPVIITLAACERTAPWEMPQETGAFVQVDILERGQTDHTRVFSGWLFKESPSLNVVEHPIYDVWVKDCAMSFPGDE